MITGAGQLVNDTFGSSRPLEWEFISAIREQRDCVPSFFHGMRAQGVAEAILQAAAKRRWVDVPVCAP